MNVDKDIATCVMNLFQKSKILKIIPRFRAGMLLALFRSNSFKLRPPMECGINTHYSSDVDVIIMLSVLFILALVWHSAIALPDVCSLQRAYRYCCSCSSPPMDADAFSLVCAIRMRNYPRPSCFFNRVLQMLLSDAMMHS